MPVQGQVEGRAQDGRRAALRRGEPCVRALALPRRRGLRRVALLGTIYTMGGDFYRKTFDRYGLETVTPDEQAQQRINRIIYDELVLAEVKKESKDFAVRLIDQLAAEEGIEHTFAAFAGTVWMERTIFVLRRMIRGKRFPRTFVQRRQEPNSQ